MNILLLRLKTKTHRKLGIWSFNERGKGGLEATLVTWTHRHARSQAPSHYVSVATPGQLGDSIKRWSVCDKIGCKIMCLCCYSPQCFSRINSTVQCYTRIDCQVWCGHCLTMFIWEYSKPPWTFFFLNSVLVQNWFQNILWGMYILNFCVFLLPTPQKYKKNTIFRILRKGTNLSGRNIMSKHSLWLGQHRAAL